MPLPDATSFPPYCHVTCEQLALTLLQEGGLQHLEPFASGPRTLSDLSRELEQPLYKLRRWVLRMVDLGVLEVARVEERAGRAIRHYGLTHTDFFVPTDVLPVEEMLRLTEETVNARLNRQLARELTESQGIGGYHIHLEAGNSGVLMVHSPFKRWHPTLHSDSVLHLRWLTLNLDHAQAVQLQNELAEVLARYMDCNGPQEYLVALKMVADRK